MSSMDGSPVREWMGQAQQAQSCALLLVLGPVLDSGIVGEKKGWPWGSSLPLRCLSWVLWWKAVLGEEGRGVEGAGLGSMAFCAAVIPESWGR